MEGQQQLMDRPVTVVVAVHRKRQKSMGYYDSRGVYGVFQRRLASLDFRGSFPKNNINKIPTANSHFRGRAF